MQTLTATKWLIDNNHTCINFKVKHLGLAYIPGSFSEFEGACESASESDFEGAQVRLSIQSASVNTGNDMRDNHLRTADFLDSFTYPDIVFESTSFTKETNDTYKIVGNLTIKNIAKPITLKGTYGGTATDLWGNRVAAFHVSGSIDRLEYGVSWNEKIESGIAAISKEVVFDMSIELILQDA